MHHPCVPAKASFVLVRTEQAPTWQERAGTHFIGICKWTPLNGKVHRTEVADNNYTLFLTGAGEERGEG